MLFESTNLQEEPLLIRAIVVSIIVIALLLFAKKFPELLKEIFPNMGGGGAAKFDFGLNAKKQIKDTWAAGAIGAVGGALGAGTSNAIHGFMSAKKEFKENGVGAGLKAMGKGLLSTAGGILGGANEGRKVKDITKTSDAIRIANQNREKRELKAQAGYKWYRQDKVISDKILSFAGETSGAEKQIKTAEFRKNALEQSKAAQWQNFADTFKTQIQAGTIDLSLLRSMQEFDVGGKKVWKGIDKAGKEQTYKLNSTTGDFEDMNGAVVFSSASAEAQIVKTSANVDKLIKKQGKVIKGLQTADRDAKSKK